VLKKSVFLVFSLSVLSGCGYKGALYIPDTPEQNAPAESTSNETQSVDSSSNINSTLPAPTSGELN